MGQWSKKDAEIMPTWDAWPAAWPTCSARMLLTAPAEHRLRKPATLSQDAEVAWRNRGLNVRTVADATRLMTMSIADLLDDWFESSQVKGALAVNGVIGTWAGPYSTGTAYVMAHHSIGDVGDGHLGNWGFQEGGMGAVSDAIEAAARAFGVEVRVNAPVSQVLMENGKAVGVALETATSSAPARSCRRCTRAPRSSTRSARRTCRRTSPGTSRHWKTRSGVVKINLALSELPSFTADPGTELRRAPHRLGRDGAVDGVHRARVPGRPDGRPAPLPFSDGVIPTAFDKTLCPEGSHIMSLFTQ